MREGALQGWAPIRVFRPTGQTPEDTPMVELCDLSGIRPTEPFFEATLQRAMREPYRVLFRREVSLDALEAQLGTVDLIAPSGFIFHMSRCGSTLISQMLAASARNVVISEGWAIDSLLQAISANGGAPPERVTAWVRTIVRALGQEFAGGAAASGCRYFVKFDAWHALALPLLRRAFPETPGLFVFRDPVEVMVSQMKRPAHWAAPGAVSAHWTGITAEEAWGMEPAEFTARLLGAICESALVQMPKGGRALNYRRLPGAVFEEVASHFGCRLALSEASAMSEAAAFDAKDPDYFFESDTAEKQRTAGVFVRLLSERWLRMSYDKLESLT